MTIHDLADAVRRWLQANVESEIYGGFPTDAEVERAVARLAERSGVTTEAWLDRFELEDSTVAYVAGYCTFMRRHESDQTEKAE